YHDYFFEVRPRLRARDWIVARVIGAGLWLGFERDDLGGVWKAFGYFGGPTILDAVLAVSRPGGPKEDETTKGQRPSVQQTCLDLRATDAVEAIMREPRPGWHALYSTHQERCRQEGGAGSAGNKEVRMLEVACQWLDSLSRPPR